ncbi:hypothetical protein AHAS_Ahas02G0168500 [Arachis hypogaea]
MVSKDTHISPTIGSTGVVYVRTQRCDISLAIAYRWRFDWWMLEEFSDLPFASSLVIP